MPVLETPTPWLRSTIRGQRERTVLETVFGHQDHTVVSMDTRDGRDSASTLDSCLPDLLPPSTMTPSVTTYRPLGECLMRKSRGKHRRGRVRPLHPCQFNRIILNYNQQWTVASV